MGEQTPRTTPRTGAFHQMSHYNEDGDEEGGDDEARASQRSTPANPFLGLTRERRPKEQRLSVAVRDPANQLSFVKVREPR